MDWVKGGSEVVVRQRAIEVEGGWYRCAVYEIGKVGRVIHMIPSVGARRGCDEMFTKYQTQDIEFRRARMLNGKGIPCFRHG